MCASLKAKAPRPRAVGAEIGVNFEFVGVAAAFGVGVTAGVAVGFMHAIFSSPIDPTPLRPVFAAGPWYSVIFPTLAAAFPLRASSLRIRCSMVCLKPTRLSAARSTRKQRSTRPQCTAPNSIRSTNNAAFEAVLTRKVSRTKCVDSLATHAGCRVVGLI